MLTIQRSVCFICSSGNRAVLKAALGKPSVNERGREIQLPRMKSSGCAELRAQHQEENRDAKVMVEHVLRRSAQRK